jgi:uncharacterized protein (UPF0335 family)
MAKNDEDDLVDNSPRGGIGHNARIPSKEVMQVITHIEALIEQRVSINEEIRDAMDTAKIKGMDKHTIKEMIKLRAMDAEKRTEREHLRDQYLIAVGLA